MPDEEIQTRLKDRLKVVIMVGRPDFGRCPVATRLNRAMWPLSGRPVLQRLIERMTDQGAQQLVVCGSEDIPSIRDRIEVPPRVEIAFRQERLPRGSAGCIFDAARADRDNLILVLPATMTCPPDLDTLIRDHCGQGAPMTVFFDPADDPDGEAVPEAQIYACQPSVLKYIPAEGYCDIKEGLVPKLIQADLPVASVRLKERSGSYTNWNEYMGAVGDWLMEKASTNGMRRRSGEQAASDFCILGEDVRVDPTAQVVGPVVIGSRTVVEPNALICGPTVVEADARVGANSVVCESILWDGAQVGTQCRLRNCLVDANRVVSPETVAREKLFHLPDSIFGRVGNAFRKSAFSFSLARSSPFTLCELLRSESVRNMTLAGFVLLAAALVFSYLNPTFINLVRIWSSSDEYSSGMLVPFLAAYILWHRRKDWLASPIKPMIAAAALLLGAQVIRFFGLFYYYDTLDRFSFLFSVAALVILVLGISVFKKFATVWLFCFLMFPLPTRFERLIALPLQKWATVSAVYVLETLGYNVVREGNVININNTLVAVAEACNGLRMLTAFFVVSGFVVLLTERDLWQKALILLSSIPIALICNTIRLTITSVAFTVLDTQTWEQRFHDFGGLAMMPVALGMVMLELWFFSHLFLSPTEPSVAPVVIKQRNNPVKDGTFSGST